MSKKIKIFLLCLILIISIVSIIVINRSSIEKESIEVALNKINEDYFDIRLDIENKTAVVDGEKVQIADLFAVSNDELEEMINNNTFNSFLNENIVGDLTYNEDSITINNPYSTNKIIVQTSNEEVFENQENITSVEKIAEDIYIVDYINSSDTKKGYEDFKTNDLVQNTMKDLKFSVLSDSLEVQSVSTSNLAWGVSSTGLGNYTKLLNDTENNKTIKIAVLDSGINTSHKAFSIKQTADKLDTTYSYDYVNKDNNVADDNGHGTQVAGVIAESTSNNIKIVPVKVMGSNGQGSVSTVLQAIADIYEKVDIINLSLGISINNFSDSDMVILENFFKEIYDNGKIVVCATGNDNTGVYYPAASNYTLAAGAIDQNNNKADFSNYGDSVDFALPGVKLKLPNYTSDTAYVTASGTSYSSPFLASAVALVKADYNYTNISDIVNVLKQNAQDLGTTGKDIYYGYGAINFDLSMFRKPVISYIKAIDTKWAAQNTILVKTISSSNIKSYAVTSENKEPTEWTNFILQSTNKEFEAITTNNGINYIWIKDANNNVSSKSVTVSYVDSVIPSITGFSTNSITDSSISIQITANDSLSGLSKIKWYYKKSSDLFYNSDTETINGNTYTNTHVFNNLSKETQYSIYAELEDKAGNKATTSVVNITTKAKTITLSLQNKTLNKAKVTIDSNNYTSDFNIKTDVNRFRITCNNACVVLISYDSGKTYSKLNKNKIDTNIYEYIFNNEQDVQIIVALKGDINLNGELNAADVMEIYRSLTLNSNSAFKELSNIEKIIADIDDNGTVNSVDTNLINNSNISPTSTNYKKIEW